MMILESLHNFWKTSLTYIKDFSRKLELLFDSINIFIFESEIKCKGPNPGRTGQCAVINAVKFFVVTNYYGRTELRTSCWFCDWHIMDIQDHLTYAHNTSSYVLLTDNNVSPFKKLKRLTEKEYLRLLLLE